MQSCYDGLDTGDGYFDTGDGSTQIFRTQKKSTLHIFSLHTRRAKQKERKRIEYTEASCDC